MPDEPDEPSTDEHRTQPTAGPRPKRPRRRSAAERVRGERFPVAMRGYERTAVDAWREDVAQLVERLEEQAPRDSAVKRALDEVGKETSAILHRAHESSEEITARSRSQAEGRLRRAEGEAEITIREAEERAEQLELDAQRIWEERSRLIDEMRGLADEVLGVADDASDRLDPPRGRSPDPRSGVDGGPDTEGRGVLDTDDGGFDTQDSDLDTEDSEANTEDRGADTEDATGAGRGGDQTLDEAGDAPADQPTRIVPPSGGRPPRVLDQTTVESAAARPDGAPPPGGAPR
jgi:cell division septum initiation protein DivIVA